MRPKNRTEREVVAMSESLPSITKKQEWWAVRNCTDIDYAYNPNNRRHNDIEHFIVVTQHNGWQLLRHYYIYSHFAYRKLKRYNIAEVMQEWFCGGKYVLLARDRMQGWADDGWIFSRPMTVKRDFKHCWLLRDPRTLPYTAVYYARRTQQFRYLPRRCDIHIGYLYRAVNASPYCETLLKQDPDLLKYVFEHDLAYSAEKMHAVKIARRHGYDWQKVQWCDLVDMLAYLGRDLHNPALVCPANLAEMHDKVSKLASNKRTRIMNTMSKLSLLSQEKARLNAILAQERRNEEQREKARGQASHFVKARQRFFALHFEDNALTIDPLKSIDEFYEEGKEMGHCVFSCGYYDVAKKPDSLILTARVDGKRTETVEVNIATYTITQARGKHNAPSPYHDTIVELVTKNLGQIKALNGR